MNVAGWVAVGLAAWVAAGLVVARVIGAVIRRRDEQIPSDPDRPTR